MKKVGLWFMNVISFSLGTTAFAGSLKIINENKKELEIIIQAEGDSLSENLPSYTQKIPPEHYSTLEINSRKLKSKSHYSISGKTNPILGDTCKHLSVAKNYQITFENDTIGTTCLAEEMRGSSKGSKKIKK